MTVDLSVIDSYNDKQTHYINKAADNSAALLFKSCEILHCKHYLYQNVLVKTNNNPAPIIASTMVILRFCRSEYPPAMPEQCILSPIVQEYN